MMREKEDETKCCEKEKEVKREGKPTQKIFKAPRTMAEEKPEVGIKGWAPDPRPYFFKILHPDQSREHLRIPPYFMEHLPKDMSNQATLKCSSGRYWNIKLRPAIGSMYLQDGWQQFLIDNSLGDREFLLFRYDGNMCFNVQLFEKSGCERFDMSVTKKHQESPVPEVKKKRGRPQKNPPLKSCGNGPGQCHLQMQQEKLKKVRKGTGILSLQEVDSDVKKSKDGKSLPRKTRTGVPLPIRIKDSYTTSCSSKRLPVAEEVEEDDTVAFERVAKSFSSGFPYFQSSMKKSSVDRIFIQHIPAYFSKLHLQNIRTRMSLINPRGETWEVNCIPTGQERHYLCGGWAAFARENDLRRGDICIFELVSRNEMQVHIYRM